MVENHLNVQSGSGRSAVLVVLNSIPECLHRFCDTCMKIFSSAALNAQLTELGSLTGGLRKDQLLENIGSPK